MAIQIIARPDGRFAIFDNDTDTLIESNMTSEQVVQWYVDRATDPVAAGTPAKVYFQFVLTWAEALEIDRSNQGPSIPPIQ